MRYAAAIVLAMTALLLQACAGRGTAPYQVPTYGTPAPRYTPIPPLGERMSTNGRVFIVARLDPKDYTAARDLWTNSEFQVALSTAGQGTLLNDPKDAGVAWDLPRPLTRDGFFAYFDGSEYDRDLPFTSIEDLMDWLERVRTQSIDETYADHRLRASGNMPGVQELKVHAMRMIRLGNYERALDSLLQANELHGSSADDSEAMLSLCMREVSRACPPAKEQLSSLAIEAARAWKSDSFKGVNGPFETRPLLEFPTRSDQMAMYRFAELCVAADRFDILEARLAECQSDASESKERSWLLAIAAGVYCASGFADSEQCEDLLTIGGRLAPDPKASALQEIQRPLAWIMLSDASRESTVRKLGPELKYAGVMTGFEWCACQAAGRTDDADEIMRLLGDVLNYPRAIEALLEVGIFYGYLPKQTDEWLARGDLDPARRELLKQGVEALRRQPMMTPVPE